MDIGIGLPATIPGATRTQVLDWAQAAERRGFSTLGVIDRIVYGNMEPLTVLAAAAAVTESIGLTTSVLLAPTRHSAAMIAKQAATVEVISEGRLVLGMAVGSREDDFTAAGAPFTARGKRFDAMLEEMQAIWAGESRGIAGGVGPSLDMAPKILIGGGSDRSYERAARIGYGWIAGGGGPDQFAEGAAKVKAAWSAHGVDGEPRLVGLGYFSLGADARQHAEAYLSDYYGFTGMPAETLGSFAVQDADALRGMLGAFEQAGCDELILFPCNPDPEQVELLADVSI